MSLRPFRLLDLVFGGLNRIGYVVIGFSWSDIYRWDGKMVRVLKDIYFEQEALFLKFIRSTSCYITGISTNAPASAFAQSDSF